MAKMRRPLQWPAATRRWRRSFRRGQRRTITRSHTARTAKIEDLQKEQEVRLCPLVTAEAPPGSVRIVVDHSGSDGLSGSRGNLRLAAPVDLVALRAAEHARQHCGRRRVLGDPAGGLRRGHGPSVFRRLLARSNASRQTWGVDGGTTTAEPDPQPIRKRPRLAGRVVTGPSRRRSSGMLRRLHTARTRGIDRPRTICSAGETPTIHAASGQSAICGSPYAAAPCGFCHSIA